MRKWQRGERITDPEEALRAILSREVLFHNHKPQTHGWLRNWSIHTLWNETRQGRVFRAIPNEKEVA